MRSLQWRKRDEKEKCGMRVCSNVCVCVCVWMFACEGRLVEKDRRI